MFGKEQPLFEFNKPQDQKAKEEVIQVDSKRKRKSKSKAKDISPNDKSIPKKENNINSMITSIGAEINNELNSLKSIIV